MIKLLNKLQIWRNGTIEYGFYTQSSIFQPHRVHDGERYRKQELRFCFGRKDWRVKFI